MAESEFATTILTSKTPEEVANFLPHSLNLSSTLIEKNLAVWFTNYLNMLIKHNQDLNMLVANGRNFFTRSGDEFGSVDKIWNCLASCVTSQIGVNDALIKVIKNDIINQLQGVFHSDFKFLELIVNLTELVELKDGLNGPNGDYNWNVKAPAILSNFENYKRFEKGLLLSCFLSYLNTVNTKTAGLLHKNENAVNYILKEYNIDAEMASYTKYMVDTSAPAQNGVDRNQTKPLASLPPKPQTSRASVVSATPSTGTKKTSKLRARMGSILGRKKKHPGKNGAETIPEDHSISSVPSRQPTHLSVGETRHSMYTGHSHVEPTTPVTGGFHQEARESFRPQSVETKPLQPTVPKPEPALPEPVPEPVYKAPVSEPKPDQAPAYQAKEVQPTIPSPTIPEPAVSPISEPTRPAQPTIAQPSQPIFAQPSQPIISQASQPITALTLQPAMGSVTQPDEAEEPNLVKYSSSDDDSDGPVDPSGNRLSMLQTHNLDHPPKLDTDSDFRSRNTSSGKYSFEYGDEEKELSATPKATPVTANPPAFPEAEKNIPQPSTDRLPDPRELGATRPPPPPPSRKVHNSEAPVARRDVHSLTFHNLPQARASMIQPEDKATLASQTTGNSLFKQNDYFKHFGDQSVQDGLNTSIAEIVNVSFRSGQVVESQVLGELAFNYNSLQPLLALDVRIPAKFSRFLLNELFMHQTGEGMFSLDLGPITSKTLGGLKYMMNLDAGLVPVLVKQVWKFEPHQASLIIKVSVNPLYSLSIQLDNLVISAALDGSVASTSASSKPEGSFNKEKNRITWRYNKPLLLSGAAHEEKLIARIMTNGQAVESPAGVQVKFSVLNSPAPYAAILDSANKPIRSVTSLSTGNYFSHV